MTASIALALAAACFASDEYYPQMGYAPPPRRLYQTYSSQSFSASPAVHYERDLQWQRTYQKHQMELQIERQRIDAVNRSALFELQRRPYYDGAPRRTTPLPLPKKGAAEMKDFSQTIAEVVAAHVASEAQSSGGAFLYKPESGKAARLRFKGLLDGRVERRSPVLAVAPALFEDADRPGKPVYLTFQLTKDDWEWIVAKVVPTVETAPQRAPAAAMAAAKPAGVPKPKAPAHLTAQLRFSEPSGNGRLDGGETGELEVTVSNAGPGLAYAVRLEVSGKDLPAGLVLPGPVSFGDLKKDETATRRVFLVASESLESGLARVLASVLEGNGFDTEPVLVELETAAFEAPRLELAEAAVAGGSIKPGEVVRLAVTVRNAGRGKAAGAKALLTLGSGDLFLSGEPSIALGDLESGQSRTAEFEFFVNKRAKAGALPVSLSVTDGAGRHGFEKLTLPLAMGQGAGSLRTVSVKGRAAVDDVDVPPASKTPRDPKAFAVVVGLERYRDVTGADFAARDAQVVHDYLTASMGFAPENVALLQNDRAALTDLNTYLGPWLADRAVSRDSKVFVFYSGHGTVDAKTGEAYLIPYDGNPSYPTTKGFALKDLYASLSKLPSSDVVVALDSCFSGAGGRSLLAPGTRPLANVRPAMAGPNTVVLAASNGSQISASHRGARHGLLTYFMLRGLRGDADGNSDGKVTTAELFRYLKPQVEAEARKQHVEQQPTLEPGLDALGKRASRVWIAK